ncbi:MAG: hypothetical protein WBN89_07995 [Prochlorococcaceae cyanobacterium]
MAGHGVTIQLPGLRQPRRSLQRWQAARSWARLIREAEALWRVDALAMHRLAAQELGSLLEEVPPSLRLRVNSWLLRFGVLTRLNP